MFMFYCKAPYDPELTASTGTHFSGMDYFMLPSLRNLGFSVKLSINQTAQCQPFPREGVTPSHHVFSLRITSINPTILT